MPGLQDFPFDQTKRIISVEAFAPGPKKLCVISFEGVEELSTLSRFRLEAVTLGGRLEPSEALGQKLGIAIRYRGQVRKIHGIISRMEMLRTSWRGHHLHLLELSPPAWLMTLNRRFKIFEEKAAHEVINDVLSGAGVEKQLKSVGEHREYWVQYGESDYNFMARLLEDEGLFHRFDHSEPACKIVTGDGSGDYRQGEVATLKLNELLESWQPLYRIGASNFKHGSWDYKSVSSFDHQTKSLPAAQVSSIPVREWHEYPGRHESTDAADRYSKARMGEQESEFVWVAGTTTTPMLEVGATFEAEGVETDLPQTAQAEKKFVITRVDHRARDASSMPFEGERGYDNTFHCIPARFDYRPPRVAQRPLAHGPQTAIVTDTPDEEGRCKVRFPWEGDGVSRWCRVAQFWAFNGMGSQFYPRVDSEVVVEFLHGDPDHPIITGMVYNGQNKQLYDTPGNKTQSGIRGANWGSAGEADVSNEFRFEDKAGGEEIYLHAQKDYRRVIVNDETTTVEQGNLTETIKMGNHDVNVDMGKSTLDAMQSITLTVGQNSIHIDQTGITIKGIMVSTEGQVTVDVKAPMTTVKGDAMLTLKGGITFIN